MLHTWLQDFRYAAPPALTPEDFLKFESFFDQSFGK